MNEVWTFKEQSTTEGRIWRGIQFQGVSLIGGIVQWSHSRWAFLSSWLASPEAAAVYFGDDLTLQNVISGCRLRHHLISAGKYWAQLVASGLPQCGITWRTSTGPGERRRRTNRGYLSVPATRGSPSPHLSLWPHRGPVPRYWQHR